MQPDNVQTIQPIQDVPQVAPAPANRPDPAQPAEAQPTRTNYAAAIFFTLLIVGFTFSLTPILFVPLLFFFIMAGIFFFKDALGSKNSYQPVPGQPDLYYAVPKKRSPFVSFLLVVFATLGVLAILFVGFIVFLFIALGSSGGFG